MYGHAMIMQNAGWKFILAAHSNGYFNILHTAQHMQGLKNVIVNTRHNFNSNNYFVGNPTTKSELELFKVQWRMFSHSVEVNKLSLLWKADNI